MRTAGAIWLVWPLPERDELESQGATFELPLILQARFSQASGDNEQARATWTRLYESNTRSISAIGGLAQLFAAQSHFSEATDYIDRGLKVSP